MSTMSLSQQTLTYRREFLSGRSDLKDKTPPTSVSNSTASPALDHGSIRLESQLYAHNVTETPPRDTQSIHPIPPTYSTTVHRCYIHLRWHVLYVHLIWISQATELNLLLLSTSNVMRSHIFDSTVMRRSSGCRDP